MSTQVSLGVPVVRELNGKDTYDPEASCELCIAVPTHIMEGYDFLFCGHHARKIRKQLENAQAAT